MANDVQPLTLTLPSDLRLLGVARAFIEAVCLAGRLAPDTTEAIVLAFHEAISNVIRLVSAATVSTRGLTRSERFLGPPECKLVCGFS